MATDEHRKGTAVLRDRIMPSLVLNMDQAFEAYIRIVRVTRSRIDGREGSGGALALLKWPASP